MTKQNQSIELLNQKVDYVVEKVNKIEDKLDKNYASKEWVDAEYGQTKKIVNAILVTFALGIVTAFVAFVVRGGLK